MAVGGLLPVVVLFDLLIEFYQLGLPHGNILARGVAVVQEIGQNLLLLLQSLIQYPMIRYGIIWKG